VIRKGVMGWVWPLVGDKREVWSKPWEMNGTLELGRKIWIEV
jgi:hypothetical protein